MCLRYMRADLCEGGCPQFEDAVHEGYRSIIGYGMWVFFMWFAEEAYGDGAPSCRCVSQFGHELEEAVNEVMDLLQQVFYDFIRDGVWSRRFTDRESSESGDVISLRECVLNGRKRLCDGWCL